MDEQRRFARTPFDGHALLTLAGEHDDTPFNVELRDLSLKGALVYLPDALVETSAQYGQLILELEDSDIRIPLDVRVSHCADGLMGMEFVKTNIDAMQHLRRMLELHLGEEDPGVDHLAE